MSRCVKKMRTAEEIRLRQSNGHVHSVTSSVSILLSVLMRFVKLRCLLHPAALLIR